MKFPFATMIVLGLLGSMIAPAHAANSHVESTLAEQEDLSTFHQALINTGVTNELRKIQSTLCLRQPMTLLPKSSRALIPVFSLTPPNAVVRKPPSRVTVLCPVTKHPRSGQWDKGIPTLGDRRFFVEEPYKGEYTVEGHRISTKSK